MASIYRFFLILSFVVACGVGGIAMCVDKKSAAELDAMFDDAVRYGVINDEPQKDSSLEIMLQELGCAAYLKWLAVQKYIISWWSSTTTTTEGAIEIKPSPEDCVTTCTCDDELRMVALCQECE